MLYSKSTSISRSTLEDGSSTIRRSAGDFSGLARGVADGTPLSRRQGTGVLTGAFGSGPRPVTDRAKLVSTGAMCTSEVCDASLRLASSRYAALRNRRLTGRSNASDKTFERGALCENVGSGVVTTHPLVEYFRCPEHLAALGTANPLPTNPGYFRFGDVIAYGRQAVGPPSARPDADLVDVSPGISSAEGQVLLPFDLAEVLANLRHERYPEGQAALKHLSSFSVAHAIYYFFRPLLPIGVRRHLQKLRFNGWNRIAFPHWPVDVTVETLMEGAVRLMLESGSITELPFIWFWPDGAPACVMMTHDVEGPAGAAFSGQLMDIDESFGVKSAFQLIPEGSSGSKTTTRRLIGQLRSRGFEVNVHDLSHDGHLFREREQFLRGVGNLNALSREFDSRGFRSGAMYRRQDWLVELDVSYDMSVPNVAHLEPQRGGCCTVLPFFIDRVLELPLTTVQDYTLFHILGDYSTRLWQEQIERILDRNGLISFITHPDYLLEARAREVYVDLLRILVRLRDEQKLWVALPSEIDEWWRNRREMKLVQEGGSWRIVGPGSGRARIAYLRLSGDSVVCEVAGERQAA